MEVTASAESMPLARSHRLPFTACCRTGEPDALVVMPVNQTRGTPGLLLLIFACALLLAAAGGWELRREARSVITAAAVTGVGDTGHYTALSEDDLRNPALIFSHAPQGLFRCEVNPVQRDDSKMLRVETEQTGRHSVYTDLRPNPGPSEATAPRWYLKAGNDRYVEFEGRK